MINNSPSSKIVHGIEEDDDACFEHDAAEEELQEKMPTLAEIGILGEANPIYNGLPDTLTDEEKAGLSLK